MPSLLDDVIAQINGLSDEDRAALTEEVVSATDNLIWLPSPGPQTDAYFSEADELFYGGKPGGGKLLDIITPIPTPFGWTTMGEIQVGDRVFDENGVQCNVVGKSDIEYEDTYKVIFSDGSEIIAGARHQWVTRTRLDRLRALRSTDEWKSNRRKNRPSRSTGKKSVAFIAAISERNSRLANAKDTPLSAIRTTKEIFESLRAEGGRLNHSIDVAGSLKVDSADLLIDPYVLGAWLGDGTHTSGGMTGIDEEIFQQIANHYPITQGCEPKRRGIIGIHRQLKQLGLHGNKHIPVAYLRASFDQRVALLQGLMDTDGYCDPRGQCEFVQVRKQLTDQVSELLHSLGIKHSICEGLAKLNGRVTGPKYRIKFLTDIPAFRLSRKLILQKRGSFRGTHDVRYITDVVQVDRVPMQCIQVDSPNHMYLCGRAMIPTHNSDLGVGLSLTQHRRSLFLRRQREEAKEISDRYFEVLGTRNGWNGQDLKLRTTDGKTVDIGGCNLEADKQKYKGIPHDLKFFDEIGDFTESQYRFIIIWNRSAHPGQRCRVICAGNPPTTPEGLWVIRYWGPWLDPTHPNPAKPGELRWYLGTEDGDVEVDGPGPYEVPGTNGKVTMVRAKSRTFIPAELSDNPYLRDTNYESVLAGLTGDMRNAYFLGKFDATLKDDPKQVIPTSWIRAAQDRWTPQRPQGVPMCAMGVDPTGGGSDECALAPRYDGWFPPLIVVPGKQVPFGRDIAGLVVANRRSNCVIIMDMGGGYGGSPFEILKDNGCEVVKYEGYKTSNRRTHDGKLKFKNDRAEAYWRLREALDPSQEGGSPIMLPADPALVADLTAPKFKITPNGIEITSKEDLVKQLNRSPNRGDAVVMSWWHGQKGISQPSRTSLEQGTMPRNTNGMSVNMGRGGRGGAGVNFGRRG